MKDLHPNIFTRCDGHCRSEHCDDYGADCCADWHTEEEHINAMKDCCAKAACLSEGCKVCQEYWLIFRELSEGKKLLRICQECQCPFELTDENPYHAVCHDAETGAVYFICDGCASFDTEDEPYDDREDAFDRMAERMEMDGI